MEGHCPVRVNCVASLLGVRRLFRIKICGITNADDARLAADAGADAIGLNFYAGSPRYVDIARAEAISAVLPAGVAKVGVFVNAAAREVAETAMRLALDYVQLHGEEPPEFLGEVAALSPVPILRALRFGPAGLTPLAEYLNRCDELGTSPPAVLVDAFSPAAFGGTGEAVRRPAARERAPGPIDCSPDGRRRGQRRRVASRSKGPSARSRLHRRGDEKRG
jgi:phosphoribosylanthranilate isomerase